MVRAAAAETIGTIGPPAVPALDAYLRGDALAGNLGSAAVAAGYMKEGGAPLVPALTDNLSHWSPEARAGAARALGDIGEPAKSAVPALVQCLDAPDPGVRNSAAASLARLGEIDRVEQILVDAVESEPGGGWITLPALGVYGHEVAVPKLLRRLGEEHEPWATRAADALGMSGRTDLVPLLRDAMQKGTLHRRVAIAAALARLGDTSTALPVLMEGMDDPYDEGTRVRAAEGCQWLGDLADQVIPELTLLLDDHYAVVRRAAQKTLSKLQPEETQPQ